MTAPAGSGGRVRVYIEGDAADLERAVKQSNSALARLGVGQQQLTAKTQATNAIAEKQRRNLSAIATGAKYAAGGLAVFAGAGLAKVAADGVRFNATMESNELALKNLLGSSQEAKKYLADLYETAKETPFEFTDLTSASRRLISFGLDAEKTQEILSATGDAVAAMGGGAENIDRVTLALGQMQAKGKVSAEELLQLTEAGIPAYKILQDELGLTGDQVADIGNQGIKASTAIDALTKGMEERFGGAAAKQAKTWDGLTSTMQDNWAQMTGAMTSDLFDEAKAWVPKINEAMEDITSVFERKDLSFDEKVQRSIDAIDVNLGPLADDFGKQLDDAELGEHLVDAVEWAIPKIAERSGHLGIEVAEGVAKGFIHADPLGKAVILAGFMHMLGGPSLLGIVGKSIWGSVAAGGMAAAPTVAGPAAATSAEALMANSSMFGGQARAMGAKAGDSAAAGMRQSLLARGKGLANQFGTSFGGWAGPFVAAGITSAIAGIEFGKSGIPGHALFDLSGDADNSYLENLRDSIQKIGDGDYLDTLAADAKEAGHSIRVSLVKEWIAAGDVSEEQGARIIGSIRDLRAETQDESYIDFSTTNKTFKNNIEALHRGFANSMSGIRKIGRETSEEIDSELGKGSAAGRRAMSANYRAMADNVDRLVERGVISTRQGEKRKAELIERSKLVDATEEQARRMGKAWTKGLSDQEQYTKKHVDDVIDKLERMPGPAAKAAAQVWLGQLREAAKNNPKLQDEFRDLRERIVDELGVAAVRGGNKTKLLADVAGGNFLALSDTAGGAFFTIIQNLNNSLGQLGAGTDKVDYSVVKADPNGASLGRQHGGGVFQVPGTGTGDSFHTAVPPGSFVLNRNAVNEFFGLQRGGMANVVLEPGELVFDPDAVAQMGSWLQWANNEAPRYAKGGKVAGGGMNSMIAAANEIESHHFPYLWGGGHGSWGMQPFDCSGAVSYVLHAAGLLSIPMTSGSLMSWGQPASGNEPLVVYANPHHTVMALNGRAFGTSGTNPGGGAGWIEGGNGSSLAPGAKRTMDVGAGAGLIPRVLIDGPKGPPRVAAQAGVDKGRKAANAYLMKHMPTGTWGGGDAMGGGSGVYTASWYGPAAGVGSSGAANVPLAGTMSFAELSTNPGSGGPEGYGDYSALGGLPYHTTIGVTYKGKTIQVEKLDVGAGGPGLNGHVRAIDLWETAAKALPGFTSAGIADVQISGLPGDPPGRKRNAAGKQRGGFAGLRLAGGGDSGGKKKGGKKDPPTPFDPALSGFPTGTVKPADLTYEQKLTMLGIQLTAAEGTASTEDDYKILYGQQRLIQDQLDEVNDGLANLGLTKDEKEKARKQAADATAAMRKKFAKDGFTDAEKAKLATAEQKAMKEAGSKILSTKRDELLDKLSSLTGEMAGTKDSIESLNETASEALSDTLADLLEAVTSLSSAITEHNQLLSRESSVQNSELVRAIADLLDGEIGSRVDSFSNTAGYGTVATA